MTGNSHRIENNIPSGLETSASTVAPIDSTDAIIVDILEHDGRATLTKLAKASGLSVSAVQSRVQKLERKGIITGYRALIDYERRGLPVSAFVAVTPLDFEQEASVPTKLKDIDGIEACYSITGSPSFMLVVRVATPSKLEELINTIHHVVPVSTETTMVLQTYFD